MQNPLPSLLPTHIFRRFPAKILTFSIAAAVLFAGFQLRGYAQASGKAPSIRTETLTTADGWSIPITYYESSEGKDASVVILLHGENENQLVWEKNGLAKQLQAKNFAVVTCDLRKHGNAKSARTDANKELTALDYKAMASATRASELEVIHDFLFKEHQDQKLNMAKLAIVAPEKMAPVALNWAANDWLKKPYQDAPTAAAMTPRGQTVRAIVLVSPTENVPGLSSAQPLLFFKKMRGATVSFLFVSGSGDGSARDVRTMFKQVYSDKSAPVFKETFPVKFRGTDLVGRVPQADVLILGFLKKQVQDLKIAWRDRRSRLER